jgi:hypothetical protein
MAELCPNSIRFRHEFWKISFAGQKTALASKYQSFVSLPDIFAITSGI